jgi:hypothetical protein
VILFVSLLSSCAKFPIKDSEWCGDLGQSGASCFNTLSDKQRDIPKDKWDEERLGMICTKSQTFSDWQAVILKLCKASKRCTFTDKKIIINFVNNVKNIDDLARASEFDIR